MNLENKKFLGLVVIPENQIRPTKIRKTTDCLFKVNGRKIPQRLSIKVGHEKRVP